MFESVGLVVIEAHVADEAHPYIADKGSYDF